MAVLIGKNVQDNLYYVSVNGSTEILSEDAAVNLFLSLGALLEATGQEPEDVPPKDKQH